MIETSRNSRYVVQRLVHGSFGSQGDMWVAFTHERVCSRETAGNLRFDPTNRAIAEATLLEVSKARPYEQFRLALETTIVERDIELAVGPRKALTPADIAEFIKGRKVDEADRDNALAIAHDGFRLFNGVVPAMREIHLNPWHFGAYRIPVVEEALRQHAQGRFEDKWIPLYADVDPRRNRAAANSYINFGRQAEIVCEVDGIDRERIRFCRTDYAGTERPSQIPYRTLDDAKAGKPVKAKRRNAD